MLGLRTESHWLDFLPGDFPQVQAELGGIFDASAGRVICRAGSQGLEEHGKSRHPPAPTSDARQEIIMGLPKALRAAARRIPISPRR